MPNTFVAPDVTLPSCALTIVGAPVELVEVTIPVEVIVIGDYPEPANIEQEIFNVVANDGAILDPLYGAVIKQINDMLETFLNALADDGGGGWL